MTSRLVIEEAEGHIPFNSIRQAKKARRTMHGLWLFCDRKPRRNAHQRRLLARETRRIWNDIPF